MQSYKWVAPSACKCLVYPLSRVLFVTRNSIFITPLLWLTNRNIGSKKPAFQVLAREIMSKAVKRRSVFEILQWIAEGYLSTWYFSSLKWSHLKSYWWFLVISGHLVCNCHNSTGVPFFRPNFLFPVPLASIGRKTFELFHIVFSVTRSHFRNLVSLVIWRILRMQTGWINGNITIIHIPEFSCPRVVHRRTWKKNKRIKTWSHILLVEAVSNRRK